MAVTIIRMLPAGHGAGIFDRISVRTCGRSLGDSSSHQFAGLRASRTALGRRSWPLATRRPAHADRPAVRGRRRARAPHHPHRMGRAGHPSRDDAPGARHPLANGWPNEIGVGRYTNPPDRSRSRNCTRVRSLPQYQWRPYQTRFKQPIISNSEFSTIPRWAVPGRTCSNSVSTTGRIAIADTSPRPAGRPDGHDLLGTGLRDGGPDRTGSTKIIPACSPMGPISVEDATVADRAVGTRLSATPFSHRGEDRNIRNPAPAPTRAQTAASQVPRRHRSADHQRRARPGTWEAAAQPLPPRLH